MSKLRIERVLALPGVLTASTMYIVKSAAAPHAEVYFTNADGTEARHIINKAEINTMITDAIASFSNIEIVANNAARDALVLTHNALVLSLDATADVTVITGAALYVYNTTLHTFTKVSEFESMDVTLTWAAIQNKPASAVLDIDDAVAKRHAHANAVQLALVGEDVGGHLTYNGLAIEADIANAAW
jgi:flagella basal body P-ring formation protein FlgA